MRCKLCNTEATEEFVVSNKSWKKKYYLCSNCNFIFAESNAVLDDKEQFRRYSMHNNKIDDPVYRDYFEKFINYAFQFVENTNKKVLDFGSGPEPVLADVLNEIGYEVNIFDKFFSPNEDVFEEKYQVVTSTEVFEHLEYPAKYLVKLINILENGGYLILMTCFNLNDISRFSKWWYIQDPTHISFFSPKTFEYMASKYNLQLVAHNAKNIVVFRKV